MYAHIDTLPSVHEPLPLLITVDEFMDGYRPVLNAMNPSALFEGWLYAATGPEFDVLCTASLAKIWTLSIGSLDLLTVLSGLALQGRLGHLVTRVSHDEHISIQAVLSPFDLFGALDLAKSLPRLFEHHDLSRGMQIELARWHAGEGCSKT